MAWYARCLILFGALSNASQIIKGRVTLDPEQKVVDDCKDIIKSQPAYLDMCRRICGIVVSENRCVAKGTGADLAACVAKQFPYCTDFEINNNVIEDCKKVVTSQPAYLDMCRRNCANVVTESRCVGQTTGADLAECVAREFPYCFHTQTNSNVIDSCRDMITSDAPFLDMCQRGCRIVVTENRCVGKTSGTDLATCVTQQFPYCRIKN